MKLIIAGSRNINFDTAYDIIVQKCLELKPTEIVTGNSGNVDLAGNLYANNIGHPLSKFNPDWEQFGKSAGPRRNRLMAKYADVLLLIWDGKSRGSSNMKQEMTYHGKQIYEVVIDAKV